jgi:hypothetical protein
VFTARYALSPYIKQIRFVFKGLILFRKCSGLSLKFHCPTHQSVQWLASCRTTQVLPFDALRRSGCVFHAVSCLMITGDNSSCCGMKLITYIPIIYRHIKNEWSWTSTSPYTFTAWRLTRRQLYLLAWIFSKKVKLSLSIPRRHTGSVEV